MGDEPSPALNRFQLPGRKFWERVAYVVLTIAILVCIVYIWFLGMQARYEFEATKYFKDSKFSEAAEKYLLAYDQAQWGKDRYLYLVALSYCNAKDPTRSMDFVVRLASEYKESAWVEAARVSILPRIGFGEEGPEIFKAESKLGRARATMLTSYRRVLTALTNNKSGTTLELTTEYEAYKKYWTAYNDMRKAAHKAVASGTPPDKLDEL